MVFITALEIQIMYAFKIGNKLCISKANPQYCLYTFCLYSFIFNDKKMWLKYVIINFLRYTKKQLSSNTRISHKHHSDIIEPLSQRMNVAIKSSNFARNSIVIIYRSRDYMHRNFLKNIDLLVLI